MIQIKKTKSVEMFYDDVFDVVHLTIKTKSPIESSDPDLNEKVAEMTNESYIPMSKIFQVQRGLTTAIARFYRKEVKKHGR